MFKVKEGKGDFGELKGDENVRRKGGFRKVKDDIEP